MRRLIAVFTSLVLSSTALAQESVIPPKRIVVSTDVDFYGGDLAPLFDTTYEACITACMAQDSCQAFTFNTRSNACFPKTEVADRSPYEGARSAEVFETKPTYLAQADSRRAKAAFLSDSQWMQALQLAQSIGRYHASGPWNVTDMLDALAARRSEGNIDSAIRWAGGAVAKADTADLWLEYARLNLAFKENGNTPSRNRDRAFAATMNAYLRGETDAIQASALGEMAPILQMMGRGRQSIDALRLAQELHPRQDFETALDDAIAKYGFRVVETAVESDAADPRICAQFSEPLRKVGVDYDSFVRRPDQRLAVVAEGNRLCISGVEHGVRYQLTLRSGLPAESGEVLTKDVPIALYVRDRTPSLRFPGRAYVLPKSADAGLPIETVNLDEVELTLRRVSDRNLLRVMQDQYFGRPLTFWQERTFDREVAETIWQGQGKVLNELNSDMTTRLPIGDVVSDLDPGVYALTAAVPGDDPYDETDATQWFVLSNLGVSTLSGADGLHVFLRGLADAQALEGASITLLSRSNRVLGTATSNVEGYARFDAGLARGIGPAAPALLVLEAENDFTFLSLTDPAFDLSDRGVEGRPPAPPIDVFATTDRGAYRAGETIQVTALMRGDQTQAISGLPMTAILKRPDGVEYSRHLSTDDVAGGRVFSLPVATTAPRGAWTISLFSDVDAPALAHQTVLVEDFLPERIDFDLSLPEGTLRVSDTPPLSISARYLFGAPGADLSVEGEVTLRAQSEIDDYPGYHFGRHDERFEPRTAFFDGGATDAEGQATVALSMPEAGLIMQPLRADVTVRISEGSGRPVERQLSHPVSPQNPMIGIRPLFDDIVPEGSEATFEIIALNPDLKQMEMPVKWTLNRVETRYQWYQLNGNWEWEPITSRTRIAAGDAQLSSDPFRVSAPVEWGEYELIVERVDGSYVSGSMSFFAGWYAPADVSATPDTLELSLDKPAYKPGETAQLRIVPRSAGTALISVMSNRLIAMKSVSVTEGENLVELPVTDEWGAGAYVTASVIRPSDQVAGQMPSRALGLSYAQIDPGAKQLSVTIDAPEKIAPNQALDVAIVVDGVAAGGTAFVTLAAVDVGILNLTRFQSPNPSDHYFGQRRLGMDIRDIYGRLINGMNGAMGTLRSGGDAGQAMKMQSPPPTEKLVSYFEGPVTVGDDGRAIVSFDLPEFNGTVRLMAVAWSTTGVGQAEHDVIVRQPIVVTASLPRFMAPGDQSRLLLEITHTEDATGTMPLRVTANGVQVDQASLPSEITLAEKETKRLLIPITAGAIGDHTFSIELTTPSGKIIAKSLTLPVRSIDPNVSTTERLTLAAGDSITLDQSLFGGLYTASAEAVISAGAISQFDAPGLLRSLDQYPYGCTEQVTSRALPLLYFEDVASALGLGQSAQIHAKVDQSITQILSRQSANGSFGLWFAASGDFWLDAYVSDFLSRARSQGYAVPDIAFRQALDNLRNRINYAPDFDKGGQDIAYALMVLAREGSASMGDLRYYADVKSEAFDTPLASAQLGAALAHYGDQTRSDRLFRQAAQHIAKQAGATETSEWRTDYGSGLRDAAGVLSLATEVGSNSVDSQSLSQQIANVRRGFSTQESAWALMAAHALNKEADQVGLSVNGTLAIAPFVQRYNGVDAPMTIANTSTAPIALTLTTVGKPNSAVEKGGYGLAIDRSYFTMQGDPIDPQAVQVGDRFVTVLKVSPFEKLGARLMVNDALPAGFEIDNPNLLRSGDIREMKWLKLDSATHTEFRSDRFLAAVDWRSDKPFQLAYIVRAVSPGVFHHPAASVEDMYRPQYRARSETGRMVIGQ